MAAHVLLMFYKGEVGYKELIAWILKEKTPDVLLSNEDERDAFVSYFLSFLREASATQKQDSVHSGLTPRKQGKVDGDCNKENQVSCRTAKFESGVNVETKSNTVETRCHDVNNRNRIRHASQENYYSKSGELRSRQKLSLGNFITPNKTNSVSPHLGESLFHPFKNNSCLHSKLNLEDEVEYPSIGSQQHIKRKQTYRNRRITPTLISKREPLTRLNNLADIAFDSINDLSDAQTNLNDERTLLRQQRRNMQMQASTLDTVNQTRVFKPNLKKIEVIEPNDISMKSDLENLANLYAALIKENLVPCLSAELYFAFQLLTVSGVQGSTYTDFGLENIFLSAANCVYFAVQVLYLLRKLLVFLDKHTIKLLTENSRVELFSPSLKRYLLEHLNSKQNIYHLPDSVSTTIQGVAFRSETNSRNNFINEKEFNLFKKKRDLFYGLIREWESNHDNPNWSMESSFAGKIKSLVELGGDSASFAHFAKLFQAQLIVMCRDDYLKDTDSGTETICDLNILKNSNPEKLKLLEKRFFIPYKFGGVSPPPTFPSYQEFFKFFIISAGSHHFNQHLGDILSSKLKEHYFNLINLVEGFSEHQADFDCATRTKVISLLMTLKLLAKFLGLIVFLPYNDGDSVAKEAEHALIMARNSSQPICDIRSLLDFALKNNTVILLIPWLVDFLSMMDYLAPRLSYYQSVIKCFYQLYSCIGKHSAITHSEFLFRILVEWLFQIIRSQCGETILDAIILMKTDCHIVNYPLKMDPHQIIDDRILYLCCPFLKELKYLLLEFSQGVSNSSSSTRKIKPVSTNVYSSALALSRQLELKLEENFLHNQPTLVKGVVEFVSGRISSNVIKYARDHTIPKIKRGASVELIKIGTSLKEENEDALKSSKLSFAHVLVGLAKSVVADIRCTVIDYCKSYCQERIQEVVKPLLPDETTKSVEEKIGLITLRLTFQQVNDWLINHVTENNFHKDMLQEVLRIRKEAPSVTKATGECKAILVNHDQTLPQPSYSLNTTKDLLKRLWSDMDVPTYEQVQKNLCLAYTVFQNRQDILHLALKAVLQLNVDLLIGLVVRQPNLIDNKLLNQFFEFWNGWRDQVMPHLTCMFSERSLYLIHNFSSDLQLTLTKWKLLQLEMLKNGFVKQTCLQET